MSNHTNTETNMNTSVGIDYGLGKSNLDPKTGIRFGVINQNTLCQDAFNDVWLQATDLTFQAAIDECKRELAACSTDEEIGEFFA